jgi:hypothetical protein
MLLASVSFRLSFVVRECKKTVVIDATYACVCNLCMYACVSACGVVLTC